MQSGAHNPDPGAVVRMPPIPAPPPTPRIVWIAIIVIASVLALGIGVGIGRATVEPSEQVADSSDHGRLKILSTPGDANVILDGRFVGVAPLENLDVEPGKHTVVIDVFGYQPYAGTVEVEPKGRARLTVVLAPLNTNDPTTGNVSGGIVTRLTVPRSALLPPPVAAAPAGPVSKPSAPAPVRPSPSFPAPQRPRRDCSGENSTCRDGCSRADSSCRFACPGCTSCLTSVGWDECRRQCDQCRQGCEQNKNFCETNCSSQKSSCEASNNY